VVNVETKVRKVGPQTSKRTCKKRLWGIGCKIGRLTLGTLGGGHEGPRRPSTSAVVANPAVFEAQNGSG